MKKTRTYTGGTVAGLGKALDIFIKPILGKRRFAETDLFDQWSLIVGEDIADQIVPVRVYFDDVQQKEKGTLSIQVTNPAIVSKLYYYQPQLIEKINQYFGYPLLNNIKHVKEQHKKAVKKDKISVLADTEYDNVPTARHDTEKTLQDILKDLEKAVVYKK